MPMFKLTLMSVQAGKLGKVAVQSVKKKSETNNWGTAPKKQHNSPLPFTGILPSGKLTVCY